jgi:hypothetical protein
MFSDVRKRLAAIALIAVPLLLSACGGQRTARADTLSDLAPDARQGVQTLQDAGLDVTVEGPADTPAFRAPGTELNVDGQRVEVYTFASPQDAQSAEALVSSGDILLDNQRFNTDNPPHFFREGSAIWLYTGADLDILDGLRSAFREIGSS